MKDKPDFYKIGLFQFILNIATNGFDYLGSIASFLVISVPVILKKIIK